jgi:hypothetical protein
LLFASSFARGFRLFYRSIDSFAAELQFDSLAAAVLLINAACLADTGVSAGDYVALLPQFTVSAFDFPAGQIGIFATRTIILSRWRAIAYLPAWRLSCPEIRAALFDWLFLLAWSLQDRLLYSACHRCSPLSGVWQIDCSSLSYHNSAKPASVLMPVSACPNLASHRLLVRYLCLVKE